MGTDRDREADFQRFLHPLGGRAVGAPPPPTRPFCRDCGHWEHDPGSCDGLGHVWNADRVPVVTDCRCEVHDDQRASEQPAPPLDVAQAIAFGIHRWRHPTKRMTDCDCQPYADSLADEYAHLDAPSRSKYERLAGDD